MTKKPLIILILLFITLLSTTSIVVNAQVAVDIVSYSNILPYASTKYVTNTPSKPVWKLKNKQKFINNSNYINKPYHNPNLIAELKEQQRQEALKRQREEQQRQKEKQQKLANMCYFAARTQYNRNFVYGGPRIVSHRKVSHRTVANFKEYKEVCTPIRRQMRYKYTPISNTQPAMPQ